jgi:hypothetical protein
MRSQVRRFRKSPERFEWAEKAMEGIVPDDIAREHQQLLADQLIAAEAALSRLSLDQDNHEATLHAVLDLMRSCGRVYELSEPKGRRNYNQAFFTASSWMSSRMSRGRRLPRCGVRPSSVPCRSTAGQTG